MLAYIVGPGLARNDRPGGDPERVIDERRHGYNVGAAVAAGNRSAILEFEVEDVDAVFERMNASGATIVMPTTLMPWGNRSLLLRDPDGNLVNIFSRPGR